MYISSYLWGYIYIGLKSIKLPNMTNYWIIIARRKNQKLKDASDYIVDENIWDFVSSNNDESRTPSNALKLQEDDKVLFYLSEKDRDGKSLSGYGYPIFFARATLASEFIPSDESVNKKYVKLKDVNLFNIPIEVIKPKENWEIGARGPTMLVEIKDYHKYESICKKAGLNP